MLQYKDKYTAGQASMKQQPYIPQPPEAGTREYLYPSLGARLASLLRGGQLNDDMLSYCLDNLQTLEALLHQEADNDGEFEFILARWLLQSYNLERNEVQTLIEYAVTMKLS